MRETSMYYWDMAEVKTVLGRSAVLTQMEGKREELRGIFDTILYPLLESDADNYIDYSLPSNLNKTEQDEKTRTKDGLWNTYRYAFSLAYSRAHGNEDPHLFPLVEQFNGDSERVISDEKNRRLPGALPLNTTLRRGFWPFIRGAMYRDDCNLGCSAVIALCDIETGTELIIDYGEIPPMTFMMKYGMIPESLINHHNIQEQVLLWCKPSLLTTTEPLRLKCIENSSFPVEKIRSNQEIITELVADNDALRAYAQYNMEPPGLKLVRQLMTLSMLADEQELLRNIQTNRLRGALYLDRALPLMCETIDYNIELLAPGTQATSESDMHRAQQPDTPAWERAALMARVIQRENLIMWRHAITKQGNGIRSHVDGPLAGAHVSLAEGGCAICGRTYPCKRCGRCKSVRYCSRGHQTMHWKSHKLRCGK